MFPVVWITFSKPIVFVWSDISLDAVCINFQGIFMVTVVWLSLYVYHKSFVGSLWKSPKYMEPGVYI